MNALVRSAGFLTSVQDLGRAGYRQSGISLGGALDSFALRVANSLVGNEDGAAGLEATLGTLRLFDAEREPPAFFQAGDHVRFRRISREEFDAFSR